MIQYLYIIYYKGTPPGQKISFLHCPNYLSPLLPNLGKLIIFSRTSKTKKWTEGCQGHHLCLQLLTIPTKINNSSKLPPLGPNTSSVHPWFRIFTPVNMSVFWKNPKNILRSVSGSSLVFFTGLLHTQQLQWSYNVGSMDAIFIWQLHCVLSVQCELGMWTLWSKCVGYPPYTGNREWFTGSCLQNRTRNILKLPPPADCRLVKLIEKRSCAQRECKGMLASSEVLVSIVQGVPEKGEIFSGVWF